MSTAQEHYDTLLGPYYTWMFGDYDAKVDSAASFFETRHIRPLRSGSAVDLGCGSGFQSVALAKAGFRVESVDTCRHLLDELAERAKSLPITPVSADLVDHLDTLAEPVEIVTCMGDTLPHLESRERVSMLIRRVQRILAPKGLFVVTYRDQSLTLTGTDRFIPVRSDDNAILTCFLEFAEDHVIVHDLLQVKSGNRWSLKKSCYRKLRLELGFLLGELEDGFIIDECVSNGGMITIIATRI